LRMLALEVRDDRDRFAEDDVAIADHRHLASWVEREELGRPEIALAELEEPRLVGNALELRGQQYAPRERAPGAPEDFKHDASYPSDGGLAATRSGGIGVPIGPRSRGRRSTPEHHRGSLRRRQARTVLVELDGDLADVEHRRAGAVENDLVVEHV